MTISVVKYNEETVTRLREVYGVYVLAVGLTNSDNVKVFYVGSGNIRERLTHHLLDSEENECVKKKVRDKECYFGYEEVPGGEEKRKAREAELLRVFWKKGEAECNKINP